MKKDEVPQDHGNLSKSNMKELVYATDDQGRYTTALSSGWEPKTIALSNAIEEIKERVSEALADIKSGEASPIAYFMELNKMDPGILASYVGIWQWRVKRHIKPAIFKTLSDKLLSRYADAFGITTEQLKSFDGNRI